MFTDPFDGISDEDIKTYSDLYAEAPCRKCTMMQYVLQEKYENSVIINVSVTRHQSITLAFAGHGR